MHHQRLWTAGLPTLVLSLILSGPIASAQPQPQLQVPESTAIAPIPPAPEPPTSTAEAPTAPPAGPTTPLETPVSLLVRLKERRVYLKQGDTILVSYPIAIGRRGWETPTGQFRIQRLARDPLWRHPWKGHIIGPGPQNPLGDRWIGFWTDGQNAIGFHGTPHEELIGQAVSHGCLRMRNQDVRDLFDQVRIGTPVVVEH